MQRSNEKRFEGKAVVITGASSGIGAACARAFAREGATVALVARTRSTLEAVAEEIREAGGRAEVFPADLARPEAAAGLLDEVAARLGGIDVLVSNAATHIRGPLEERSADELRQMVDVNLLAPLLLAHAALPYLRRRGGGAIVNIASLAGRVPVPGAATYSATKAALRAFSFAMAEELDGSGVRVAVVSPGPVATGFIMGDLDNVPDVVFSQPMSTAEQVAAQVVQSALDGKRERTPSRATAASTTAGYLFPKLHRALRPALKRRGQAAKRRWAEAIERGEDPTRVDAASRDAMRERFEAEHSHPVNRALHFIGVPIIAVSVPTLFIFPPLGVVLLVTGYGFNFAGHAVEGTMPALFRDPRNVIVGAQHFGDELRRLIGRHA